jgi:hypothetical protein
VLTDDPIFGRFCLGGEWKRAGEVTEIIPRDGVRRRFHAMLDSGRIHMVLERDRFASSSPIVLANDFSSVRFELESDAAAEHTATLRLSGLAAGDYELRDAAARPLHTIRVEEGRATLVGLPVRAGGGTSRFTIARMKQKADSRKQKAVNGS